MNNGAIPRFLLADREFLKNLKGSNWHVVVEVKHGMVLRLI
jgi:hypothetical protein